MITHVILTVNMQLTSPTNDTLGHRGYGLVADDVFRIPTSAALADECLDGTIQGNSQLRDLSDFLNPKDRSDKRGEHATQLDELL